MKLNKITIEKQKNTLPVSVISWSNVGGDGAGVVDWTSADKRFPVGEVDV